MKLDRRFLIFSHDIVALLGAMQVAVWLVLRNDIDQLDSGFIGKQAMIFALISSGLFLWFQTYRIGWQYLSWRQSAIIVGALGFASLIFFPLISKAHMQAIEIPSMLVLVNWVAASCLLLGSRMVFRIIYGWRMWETHRISIQKLSEGSPKEEPAQVLEKEAI